MWLGYQGPKGARRAGRMGEGLLTVAAIGFTWEHPAHLYFRRAKSSELLFGGPAVYHERLLDRLGI